MKKMIMLVVTIMVMAVALTGCNNPFKKDDQHATVSITTSDGRAYVFQSVNGSNATISGKELALKKCKVNFNMETGESAHIIFKCDACGNKQEIDIDQPWSDVIHCDCPEEIDEKGNSKEYAAIELTYNQQEETE